MSADQTHAAQPPHSPARLMERARAWLDELQTPSGLRASSAAGHYHAVFGRDTLWSVMLALEAARLRPGDADLARWVNELAARSLRALAAVQGALDRPANEEQPGKIVHEFWPEPPAHLTSNAWPLIDGRYYGSTDATYLFLMAIATVWARGAGGRALVESLWDHVLAALRWCLAYGDADGDGLVEVQPRQPQGRGLTNQVWKDSFDAAPLANGDHVTPPAAWIELQGYAIAAFEGMRALLRERGEDTALQADLARRATRIRHRLDLFWLADEQCPAMVLTPDKTPVPLVSSNIGHLLWCGGLTGARADATANRLLAPDLLSAWGLRTLSTRSYAFEPISYHRGSVWPFDSAIAAGALWRMGRRDAAREIGRRVMAAIERFDSPVELFCVLPPDWVRAPDLGGAAVLVRYTRACAVQAWSAAALLLFAVHALADE